MGSSYSIDELQWEVERLGNEVENFNGTTVNSAYINLQKELIHTNARILKLKKSKQTKKIKECDRMLMQLSLYLNKLISKVSHSNSSKEDFHSKSDSIVKKPAKRDVSEILQTFENEIYRLEKDMQEVIETKDRIRCSIIEGKLKLFFTNLSMIKVERGTSLGSRKNAVLQRLIRCYKQIKKDSPYVHNWLDNQIAAFDAENKPPSVDSYDSDFDSDFGSEFGDSSISQSKKSTSECGSTIDKNNDQEPIYANMETILQERQKALEVKKLAEVVENTESTDTDESEDISLSVLKMPPKKQVTKRRSSTARSQSSTDFESENEEYKLPTLEMKKVGPCTPFEDNVEEVSGDIPDTAAENNNLEIHVHDSDDEFLSTDDFSATRNNIHAPVPLYDEVELSSSVLNYPAQVDSVTDVPESTVEDQILDYNSGLTDIVKENGSSFISVKPPSSVDINYSEKQVHSLQENPIADVSTSTDEDEFLDYIGDFTDTIADRNINPPVEIYKSIQYNSSDDDNNSEEDMSSLHGLVGALEYIETVNPLMYNRSVNFTNLEQNFISKESLEEADGRGKSNLSYERLWRNKEEPTTSFATNETQEALNVYIPEEQPSQIPPLPKFKRKEDGNKSSSTDCIQKLNAIIEQFSELKSLSQDYCETQKPETQVIIQQKLMKIIREMFNMNRIKFDKQSLIVYEIVSQDIQKFINEMR